MGRRVDLYHDIGIAVGAGLASGARAEQGGMHDSPRA